MLFLTIDKEYIITAYDINLNEINNTILPNTDWAFEKTFYKCIHLEKEIGVFIYFRFFEGNVNYFPVLLFIEYQDSNTNIINYIIPEIIINKINIKYYVYIMLNDLIKLNNNTLCLCPTNEGDKKNIIYYFN